MIAALSPAASWAIIAWCLYAAKVGAGWLSRYLAELDDQKRWRG